MHYFLIHLNAFKKICLVRKSPEMLFLKYYAKNMCNVGRPASKPRQWKSMLTHQGWFNLLYMQPLLVSQTTEFVICISIHIRDSAPSHMLRRKLGVHIYKE